MRRVWECTLCACVREEGGDILWYPFYHSKRHDSSNLLSATTLCITVQEVSGRNRSSKFEILFLRRRGVRRAGEYRPLIDFAHHEPSTATQAQQWWRSTRPPRRDAASRARPRTSRPPRRNDAARRNDATSWTRPTRPPGRDAARRTRKPATGTTDVPENEGFNPGAGAGFQ